MQDKDKTREQLTQEWGALTQCVAELGVSESAYKKIIELLIDCKKTYYGFFKNARDALYITDRDGRFIDVNQSFLDLFGYSKEELGNLRAKEIYVNKSDRRTFQQEIELKKSVHDYAVRLRGKNGRQLDCLITASVRRTEDGSVLGYHGIIRDITEHKRMENKIRENERRYYELANSLPIAVFETDERGNFAYINDQGFKLSGYTPEDIDNGLDALQLFIPEDQDKAKEDMRRVLDGETVGGREYTGMRKDGSTYAVILYASPVIIGNRAGGLRGIVIDVTERKRAEEALHESRELYRTLYENAPVGIGLATMEGQIVDCNAAMLQIIGYSKKDEIKKINVRDTYINPEQRTTFLKQLQRGEIVQELEVNLKRKDGTPYHASLTVAPLTLRGGTVLLTIQRDVTAYKEAERKLLTYQEHLRSLANELSLAEEREQRRIASYLHDHIGHGLAMCKIKLGLLKESLPPTHRNGYVDEIKGMIEHVIQNTRSLTSELSPPVLYEMGLGAAMEWLAENVSKQYGIQVTVKNKGWPKTLHGKLQILLFQTARELLTNIVKHAQAHKVEISIRRHKGNAIQMEVKDDGVGFDASSLISHITKNGGFGLFNIRERFNLMGGHLDIQSQPGCGTRVEIVAPLQTMA
jgi:PAS domain S-box-containing protein